MSAATVAEKAALAIILEDDDGDVSADEARELIGQPIWPQTLLVAFEDAKCKYCECAGLVEVEA